MSKNIALLVNSLGGGGAERVAANLSLYLGTNNNVFLFLSNPEVIDYDYKGQIIDLDFSPSRNLPDKFYQMIQRVRKTKALKKQHGIEVSISFLGLMNVLNILTRVDDKIVISEHADPQASNNVRAVDKLFRRLYNKADSIITVSEGVKRSLSSGFGVNTDKITTIYNSFDIETINQKAEDEIEDQYKPLFDDPVIINVGRLTEQKGQWHLIRVFQKVKEETANAKLVFLGEGDLKEKLYRLVRNLGLEETVYFLGFRNNPYKFIKRAELFALPSLWEGFGNVLIESMACGAPVVASDCKSGPREILAPDTDLDSSVNEIEYAKYGILTPVLSAEFYEADRTLTDKELVFARTIIDLLQKKDLMKKYSKLSKERARDFKADIVLNSWKKIIH